MLEVRNLSAGYGPVAVLHGVNLDVHQGETVALLGANGAGKSTLFRALSALLTPTAGTVTFQDEAITARTPQDIAKRGLVLVQEGRRLFTQLTVEDNLMVGGWLARKTAAHDERLSLVYEAFPVLHEKRRQYAGELSGGQQQMLAVGRGLMANPKLLLLDEPSLGLSPIAVEALAGALEQLRDSVDLSILLAEQSAPLALHLSQRTYVLRNGEIVREGMSEEFRDLDSLRSLYLSGTVDPSPADEAAQP